MDDYSTTVLFPRSQDCGPRVKIVAGKEKEECQQAATAAAATAATAAALLYMTRIFSF